MLSSMQLVSVQLWIGVFGFHAAISVAIEGSMFVARAAHASHCQCTLVVFTFSCAGAPGSTWGNGLVCTGAGPESELGVFGFHAAISVAIEGGMLVARAAHASHCQCPIVVFTFSCASALASTCGNGVV